MGSAYRAPSTRVPCSSYHFSGRRLRTPTAGMPLIVTWPMRRTALKQTKQPNQRDAAAAALVDLAWTVLDVFGHERGHRSPHGGGGTKHSPPQRPERNRPARSPDRRTDREGASGCAARGTAAGGRARKERPGRLREAPGAPTLAAAAAHACRPAPDRQAALLALAAGGRPLAGRSLAW